MSSISRTTKPQPSFNSATKHKSVRMRKEIAEGLIEENDILNETLDIWQDVGGKMMKTIKVLEEKANVESNLPPLEYTSRHDSAASRKSATEEFTKKFVSKYECYFTLTK